MELLRDQDERYRKPGSFIGEMEVANPVDVDLRDVEQRSMNSLYEVNDHIESCRNLLIKQHSRVRNFQNGIDEEAKYNEDLDKLARIEAELIDLKNRCDQEDQLMREKKKVIYRREEIVNRRDEHSNRVEEDLIQREQDLIRREDDFIQREQDFIRRERS